MTKVTYIGNHSTKESKHIELVKYYASNNFANQNSNDFLRCDLVKRNAKDGLDFIMCYDLDEHIGFAYLGRWNDGTTSNTDTICTEFDKKVGKPIQFVKQVNTIESDAKVTNVPQNPKHYDNILVVRHGKEGYLDLFIAYHGDINSEFTDISQQQIFLGHLNDGFVEK